MKWLCAISQNLCNIIRFVNPELKSWENKLEIAWKNNLVKRLHCFVWGLALHAQKFTRDLSQLLHALSQLLCVLLQLLRRIIQPWRALLQPRCRISQPLRRTLYLLCGMLQPLALLPSSKDKDEDEDEELRRRTKTNN